MINNIKQHMANTLIEAILVSWMIMGMPMTMMMTMVIVASVLTIKPYCQFLPDYNGDGIISTVLGRNVNLHSRLLVDIERDGSIATLQVNSNQLRSIIQDQHEIDIPWYVYSLWVSTSHTSYNACRMLNITWSEQFKSQCRVLFLDRRANRA